MMARRFADLAASLRKLASVPSQASASAAKKIGEQVDTDFDAGLDPYGDPWAALEASTLERGRTPPPLTDTHAMRDSVRVEPMAGGGVSVTIDDPAVHHQYGTINMADRPIYPNRKDLPDTWRRAIEDAKDEAFTRARKSMGAFGE